MSPFPLTLIGTPVLFGREQVLTTQWDLTQPVLIHFTSTHLLVLSDEGTYRLYDLSNPQSYSQHTLGPEVQEMGIVSAKGYDEGFVVLTGGLQFMEVRGWKGGRVGGMAASGRSRLPLDPGG
jgi:hypothetical protein